MRYIISTIVILSLAGCATQPMTGNTINIEKPAADRTFNVPKMSPYGTEIHSSRIISNLSSWFADGENFTDETRLAYNQNAGAIEASWNWALALNYNNVSVSFPLKIVESPNNFIITLQCPKEMISNRRNLSITGIPEWDYEKIGKRASDVCAAAQIPMIEEIKGEVNTDFNDVSVFSNFKRKLQPVSQDMWHAYQKEVKVTTLDIEKAQRFVVPSPNISAIASIAVFPYRNGSKVVYGFGYRYSIKGDGTTTYKTSDIETIKKAITNIAND